MGDLREETIANSSQTDLEVEEGYCAKEVLNGVNKLRKINNNFCDLQINVGDKIFHAHKIIIAGFSPYFAKRIVSDFAKQILDLAGVEAEIFEVILDYAYTSKITITASNAEKLLYASCAYEVPHLTNVCAEFLGKKINLENFLRLALIASDLSCGVLADFANKFMLKNFTEIYSLTEFLELKPEFLIDVIKSDELNVSNEEQVLKAVMQWVKKEKGREVCLPKVLQYVRLAFISPKALNEIIEEESALRASGNCMYYISQVLIHNCQPDCLTVSQLEQTYFKRRLATSDFATIAETGSPSADSDVDGVVSVKSSDTISYVEHPISDDFASDASSYEQAVLCEGMYGEPGDEEFVRYYTLNIENGKVRDLLFPEDWRIFWAASVGNTLYAVGSEFDGYFVIKYDASAKSWESIPELEGPVEDIIELEGSLYLVRDDDTSSYIERYNLQSKTLCRVPEMPLLYDFRPVLVGFGGMIYAIGEGSQLHKDETNVVIMQRYDPSTNQWTQMAPIFGVCRIDCCCAFRGEIYVVGVEQEGYEYRINVVYTYNVSNNKWKRTGLPREYSRVGLVATNENVALVDLSEFERITVCRFMDGELAKESCFDSPSDVIIHRIFSGYTLKVPYLLPLYVDFSVKDSHPGSQNTDKPPNLTYLVNDALVRYTAELEGL